MSDQSGVKLHQIMDAQVWTEEFLRISPDSKDFGTMICWFSNAIMCGFDHANWDNKSEIETLRTTKSAMSDVINAKDLEIQKLRDALKDAQSWLIKHDSHGSRMQAIKIKQALQKGEG